MTHRIAAGAIVLRDNKILLVRYADGYLVAPGGRVEDGESLTAAAERETLEETGITVRATTLLLVEDLECPEYRCCKLWFLCDYLRGEIRPTPEAAAEGITEACWLPPGALSTQRVFPPILKEVPWNQFTHNWPPRCAPPRKMEV